MVRRQKYKHGKLSYFQCPFKLTQSSSWKLKLETLMPEMKI